MNRTQNPKIIGAFFVVSKAKDVSEFIDNILPKYTKDLTGYIWQNHDKSFIYIEGYQAFLDKISKEVISKIFCTTSACNILLKERVFSSINVGTEDYITDYGAFNHIIKNSFTLIHKHIVNLIETYSTCGVGMDYILASLKRLASKINSFNMQDYKQTFNTAV